MNFPAEFFQDEYRCDFLVPELMKRAWATEIEILEVVTQICEKYNLQYFAYYGTLLGAVRHQGFVPWDDDIDICLKRSDYNTLVSVLPDELPEGFITDGLHAADATRRLQTSIIHTAVKTDPSYWSLPDYIRRFHGFPFAEQALIFFLLIIFQEIRIPFFWKNFYSDAFSYFCVILIPYRKIQKKPGLWNWKNSLRQSCRETRRPNGLYFIFLRRLLPCLTKVNVTNWIYVSVFPMKTKIL